MKIAWFKRIISPEKGSLIAGYSYKDVSIMKLDDLYMTGLCCDDGKQKVLIISFDLIALDAWVVQKIRSECASILHVPESAILLTCTHNHSGPQTITEAGHEEQFHKSYVDALVCAILEETTALEGNFQEADVYFYSMNVDENLNRRYVTADNHASFLPHREELRPLADGFADKELGSLIFVDKATGNPIYTIGNYAAHPLAGHSPGLGGLRISADFPGAFRDYVTAETGAECMFISGAAGDMIPKEDELGSDSARQMGIRLGKAHIRAIIDATRNPGRFLMPDAGTGSLLRTFSAQLRAKYKNNPAMLTKEYRGKKDITMEIQYVSIGDISFVGLPGEPCAELGQEIKWHSPFRRTFIAYASTGYVDYICPANFLVAGGYEAMSHRFTARNSIDLVKTVVDGLFELRDTVFPSAAEEMYPDNLDLPLVCIPPNRN